MGSNGIGNCYNAANTMALKTEKTAGKIKNNIKTNLAAGAVGIAAGGTIGIAAKNNSVAKGLAKVADKLLNSKFGKVVTEETQSLVKTLKANPTLAKAICVVAVPALAIGSLISYKQAHNNGKIEQKYQDKLEISNKLQNLNLE